MSRDGSLGWLENLDSKSLILRHLCERSKTIVISGEDLVGCPVNSLLGELRLVLVVIDETELDSGDSQFANILNTVRVGV